jgi:stearoyl-CoA desaturase (delta-9 desaturase)
MFTTNKFNERVFHLLTFICQGSSFLNPRAYAIMHREHHAYSDTAKDPHSPYFFTDVFQMMWSTVTSFRQYERRLKEPDAQFKGNYPEWHFIDYYGSNLITRSAFGVLYIAFYVAFATHWWMFLLLPIHFMIGELFQNNHHKRPNNANFAARWFEFDPVYPVMKVMHWIRLIKLRPVSLNA